MIVVPHGKMKTLKAIILLVENCPIGSTIENEKSFSNILFFIIYWDIRYSKHSK